MHSWGLPVLELCRRLQIGYDVHCCRRMLQSRHLLHDACSCPPGSAQQLKKAHVIANNAPAAAILLAAASRARTVAALPVLRLLPGRQITYACGVAKSLAVAQAAARITPTVRSALQDSASTVKTLLVHVNPASVRRCIRGGTLPQAGRIPPRTTVGNTASMPAGYYDTMLRAATGKKTCRSTILIQIWA
jgi:hypothetical protein